MSGGLFFLLWNEETGTDDTHFQIYIHTYIHAYIYTHTHSMCVYTYTYTYTIYSRTYRQADGSWGMSPSGQATSGDTPDETCACNPRVCTLSLHKVGTLLMQF